MQALIRGGRFTLRMFSKSPRFVAIVLLSIAVGVSVNTTVFSWLQSLLLNPLPGVGNGGRLVTLETTTEHDFLDSSYMDYRDYRDQARSLSGVIAFKDTRLAMGEGEQAAWVWGELVSGNFFDVLGVTPRKGRFFNLEEQKDDLDAHPVVVISTKLWEHSFQSDPSIVGTTLRLNKNVFTIIGVAPENFKGTISGLAFDIWVPATMVKTLTGSDDWLKQRAARPFHLMARLGPGASIEQANLEIKNLAQQLERNYSKSNQGVSAVLLPIWKAPYGAQSVLRTLLGVLMGASIVILLIICSNIANLLLMRGTGREKEICVRVALGASRMRIVGQLLLESLALSLLGSIGGVLLTLVMKDSLRFLLPLSDRPISLDAKIDVTVLAFGLLLAIIAALVFGLAPALHATRINLSETLNKGGRGEIMGTSQAIRSTFVIGAVALALVAMIGSGLFIKSFQNAKGASIGFDPDHILLVGIDLSQNRLNQAEGNAFYQRITERLKGSPGVRSVSYAQFIPLGFGDSSWDEISIDGYQPRRGENMRIYGNTVSPGYFETVHIPIVQGRDFTDRDDGKPDNVTIVNESFVARFFGSGNAIGRVVKIWGQPVTVVGVVKDAKYLSLQEQSRPYMYYPFAESYQQGMVIHIKTATDPMNFLSQVQHEIKALDPNISIIAAFSMEDFIGSSFFAQKLAMILLSILGIVALVLAILGVYGVVEYSVIQRTRRFGICLALGAQRHHIMKQILTQGAILAVIGILTGVIAALALGQVVDSLLVGIKATDILTLVETSIALAAVVLLASYVPARKATAIDPLTALRYE